MKKILQFTLLLLVATLFTSCSSDSFKVDGEISNLRATTLKIVFMGDSGVVDELVEVDKKGHFSFEGTSSQPTLLSMTHYSGEPLTTMVVANGDHVKVKGDGSKPMGMKIKGRRLNEEWQLFRDEHAAFYSDPNPSRLDAAIEKYVGGHPRDMLSTVLLMADYSDFSDRGKVDKMLQAIDPKVKPESLTRALGGNRDANKKSNLPTLMSLTLFKHGGNFEEVALTGHTTLINFWVNPQDERNALISKLGNLNQDTKVIDILTESDTLHWHRTISHDPTGWQHYWAPGGPLEQGIQLLGISTMPWYAVTDSTGSVIYSGPNLTTALQSIR